MFSLDAVWDTLRSRTRRDQTARTSAAPPRLGLVLGGGGGKGGAHLGVLTVLEELGLPIDLIVGTSAGAAVGVLYAAGFSLDAIEQFSRETALRRIATPDPTRTALIGARKREALLTGVLGDRTFADLRIPCIVIATDLASGRLVAIDEGPLVPALLATTALPGIFPPVVRGDDVLADGGILNNLPVDVAEQRGIDRVIAVELADRQAGFELPVVIPPNPLARLTLAPRQFAIASRALALMIDQATAFRLAQYPPALLLRPEVSHIATLDMSHPDEGRRAGETAARTVLAELETLRDWRTAPPPPVAAPPPWSLQWSLPGAWRPWGVARSAAPPDATTSTQSTNTPN